MIFITIMVEYEYIVVRRGCRRQGRLHNGITIRRPLSFHNNSRNAFQLCFVTILNKFKNKLKPNSPVTAIGSGMSYNNYIVIRNYVSCTSVLSSILFHYRARIGRLPAPHMHVCLSFDMMWRPSFPHR